MLKRRTWIACCIAFVGVAMMPGPHEAHARPLYLKVFNRVYPDIAYAGGAQCGICHFGEKKTNLNDYGKAFAEALGERKVDDERAIEEALKKVEDKLPRKKA